MAGKEIEILGRKGTFKGKGKWRMSFDKFRSEELVGKTL